MDRGDIGIVTHSFLDNYLNLHPEVKDKIIISKKPDQIYNLAIIARKNVNPNIDLINKYLLELKKKGILKNMFKEYNLKEL